MTAGEEAIESKKLKEILLTGEYINAEDAEKAEALSKKKKQSFSASLLELGLLTTDLLGQSIAESLGKKYVDRDSIPVDRVVIQAIPEAIARKYRVACITKDDALVIVASELPQASGLVETLAPLFPGKTVEIRYTLPENIDAAFRLYEKPLSEQFEQLFKTKNASVPDVVNTVLEQAINLKVSDVHFEPRTKEVLVRFRIDGVLLEIARIPRSIYENVLNRIKVLARLPFDEHMRTQDGSFRQPHTDGEVNIRVSIAPTINGEKIVMRLLSSYMTTFSGASLGLSPADLEKVNIAAQKPFGMILVTGPTGSGKTTTLYAFLETLNTTEVNIMTIEDPVEYKVEGMNQMQTNPAIELTFARGLRTIVRQDPDVVLVGEIRDTETAEISVNAALTGHLLFSTFHSNDASTTVPRLLDMNIEPFLLASTLELIVAQRLVRKVCETCRATYSLTREEVEKTLPRVAPYFGNEKQLTLYRGKGCSVCHMTGYRGRSGIFELIQVTPEMQDLIVTRPARAAIWALAKQQGSRSLFEDGFSKVKEGVTTLEELLRVAEPESAHT